MKTSLRHHILLLLAPLLVLLAVQGGLSVYLIQNLGKRIDAILRENYDSVQAMERLNEALERIDSSFQFALAGKEDEAHDDFNSYWIRLEKQFRFEAGNITIHPTEDKLVEELRELKDQYRKEGERFYQLPKGDPRRYGIYYGGTGQVPILVSAVGQAGGLSSPWQIGFIADTMLKDKGQPDLPGLFWNIKRVTGDILQINKEHMEAASADAKRMAKTSQVSLVICLGLALGVALVVWRLVASLVRPIEAVTRAAQAISQGQLHRSIPVIGTGELAVLARTFNTMSQHLRDYRQSSSERLLRSQQTSQATIDSFPDPVLVIDVEGRVDMANPAARRLLGVTPRSEAGGDAVPWQPPEVLRQPLAEAMVGQKAYLASSFDQALNFRLDGNDCSYLPQIRPIRDPYGGILGAAVVLSDVTRFRLMDQLKTDMVSTVSHELKTPLASLRLALHLLLEETVGSLEPKQVELLVDARDNAERLLELIEHLLALARLEQAPELLHRVPMLPGELLRNAADAVAARAEGKHITLVVQPADHLPPVAVDPMRVKLALDNLLDNALNYTESGQVTLSAEQVDDNRVCLSIADTGIGIPKEYLPHVFEKFFRVPEASHPAGTGLGLAIVKEVVVAHGGEVRCESKPGQGTVFRLSLPIWKGDAA